MFLNYNDHEPPHLPAKYQNDFGSYRIEIRTREWMKSDKKLSTVLEGRWKFGYKRTSAPYSNNGKTRDADSPYKSWIEPLARVAKTRKRRVSLG